MNFHSNFVYKAEKEKVADSIQLEKDFLVFIFEINVYILVVVPLEDFGG